MIKKLLKWFDRKTPLMLIFYIFWALFWGLNGGDKFFNGSSAANLGATKAVLVDNSGQQQYTVHPMAPKGVYGVNRDGKMKHYFARLHIGPTVALVSLYVFAIFEIILGFGFAFLALWSLLPRKIREKEDGFWEVLHDRTLHRLCFKSGVFLFLVFSTGDILFGDRMELWEHGTFMILTLLTYDLWYRTDQFVSAQEAKEQGAALG